MKLVLVSLLSSSTALGGVLWPAENFKSLSSRADKTYTNWAGAAFPQLTNGKRYSRIITTITVPTPNAPPGSAGKIGNWGGNAWTGFGGNPGTALLQGGVAWNYFWNGTTATRGYYGWCEWAPKKLAPVAGLEVEAGDKITVTMTHVTNTTGTCAIYNSRTKVNKLVQLSAPTTDGSSNVYARQAEWIVEDFSDNGKLFPFASFTPVLFQGCTAVYSDGGRRDLTGADKITMSQNNKQLAAASFSGSTMTVRYTG